MQTPLIVHQKQKLCGRAHNSQRLIILAGTGQNCLQVLVCTPFLPKLPYRDCFQLKFAYFLNVLVRGGGGLYPVIKATGSGVSRIFRRGCPPHRRAPSSDVAAGFVKFVCLKERIWTLDGGASAAPPGSANDWVFTFVAWPCNGLNYEIKLAWTFNPCPKHFEHQIMDVKRFPE